MAVRACVVRATERVLASYRHAVYAVDTETTAFNGAVIQVAVVALTSELRDARPPIVAMMRPPPGFTYDKRATRVHGISPERVLAEGVADPRATLGEVVRTLKRARTEGAAVVMHNKAFDVGRINATLNAWQAAGEADSEPLLVDSADVFCTMHASKRVCGLVSARGAPRAAKNAELHKILTGLDTDTAKLHDAEVDARLTAENYLLGRARGWW